MTSPSRHPDHIREYNARYRATHKESIREYKKTYRARRPEVLRLERIRTAKAMRLKYPEKHKARHAVNGAVRSGKLIKPEACERCQKIPMRIEGHHYKGYEFPLEVLWLCISCHRKAHGEMEP